MRGDAAGAKFVVVSGDLIAHDFSCKFAKLFPRATSGDYRAFVEKTIDYVMGELRGSLPRVPVYAALGNNDSDCGDYQIDANSEFLEAAGRILTADVPAAERAEAQRTFAAGGYYSVTLPAPMRAHENAGAERSVYGAPVRDLRRARRMRRLPRSRSSG